MLVEVRAGVDKFIAIRRDLHMHPEKRLRSAPDKRFGQAGA